MVFVAQLAERQVVNLLVAGSTPVDHPNDALIVKRANGMWRSLVAHLSGGQGVASSNLVIPTTFFIHDVVSQF